MFWIDADQYKMTIQGHRELYRYWDATACVAFAYRMAEQALETELCQETGFLSRYDQVIQSVGPALTCAGATSRRWSYRALINKDESRRTAANSLPGAHRMACLRLLQCALWRAWRKAYYHIGSRGPREIHYHPRSNRQTFTLQGREGKERSDTSGFLARLRLRSCTS